MILELNGTKVTIVDKTLGYQGDNLVNTIQVTVDKDSTWNYKLDMYKGKSKCFDPVLMTREGNVCTVQLTNEILSYGGRYVFQLRGYTDTQTYHSDIFESWVNTSIEYQYDCKQGDCECDCKLPTEFYQVEDNVTEINNHPPYPGDSGKWMIWDVNKHQYVESDIDVISGGEEYQTKANLTTSVTAQSTDVQYPSAKAVYDAISNASIVTVEITGKGTDSDPYVSSMTFDEIYSAMQAGRTVVGIRPSSNPAFFIACVSFSSLITFTRLAVLNIMNDDVICESFTIFKDGHITHKNSRLEETANKVTSLSADSTDRQYPSAKAVYDAITAAKPDIVTPTAESTDTQAASAKAVWDMLGAGGSGTDISLGVTGATVGDIVKVKAVDASGKPTEWETAEMSSGGENQWTLIADVTLTESVNNVTFTELPDGTPFSFRQLMIYGGAVCEGSTARGIDVIQGDTVLQQIPGAVFATGSDTRQKRFLTEITVENGVMWGLSGLFQSKAQMMSGATATRATCIDYDQPIESVTVGIATTADTLSAGTWFRIFGR